MSSIAYSDFRTRVRARAFPDLVPENLSGVIDRNIQDALTYLYNHVPGLEGETVQDLSHEDSICLFGNSHVFCSPASRLNLIYTYLPGIRGSEIYGDEIPYPDLLAMSRSSMSSGVTSELRETAFNFLTGEPLPMAYTATPPEGRSSTLSYARFGGRIYIYPALGSNERLVMRSEKRPSSWYSTDTVDGDAQFERAVTLYVQRQNALDWDRDPQAYKLYDGEYSDSVSELIWQKERARRAAKIQVSHGRGVWPAPTEDTAATSGDGVGGGDILPCDGAGWPASAIGGKWVLSSLGRLYGLNIDLSTWHEVTVVGSDSGPSLEIGVATSTPTGGTGNTGWPAIDSAGSVILTDTGALWTKNEDDDKWHELEIYDSGAPEFQMGAPGTTAPAVNNGNSSWPTFPSSSRWILTQGGILSGKNLDTGKWHRVDAVGDTSTPSFQLSAPGTASP